MHTPDGFNIIKYSPENDSPFFLVFASWAGGFSDGDSWRRSTPLANIEKKEQVYVVTTESGTQYFLNEVAEGRLTFYNRSILATMIEQSKGKAAIVTIEEAIKEMYDDDHQ